MPVRKLRHSSTRAEVNPPAPVCAEKPGGRAVRLLDDKPTRIYVPLLMRPWIMGACHPNACCHLGVARTLSMLDSIYWSIGVNICTRWLLRCCRQCQTRESSRQTVRWTILSLPLPFGPGVAVSVSSPPSLLHLGETLTFYSLRIGSADAQTCTPPLLRNSRLKAPPTSWSRSIYLCGGVRPAPSPIMDGNYSPSCHLPRTSF